MASWFLVTACVPPEYGHRYDEAEPWEGRSYFHGDAVIIEVTQHDGDPAEAARLAAVAGIDSIEANLPEVDPNYCDTVYVLPLGDVADRICFQRATSARRAELQCCGGESLTEDGHGGHCCRYSAAKAEAD